MGNHNTCTGSGARRPIVNSEQVPLGHSELQDSYSVEYQPAEDLSSRRLAASAAQGEYRSARQQKIALTLILICEFFRNMSMHSLIYWIPLTLQLNMGFFTENGTVRTDLFERLTFRISVIPVVSFILTYGCGIIVGIFTDSCVRKTRILLVSAGLMYIGFGYLTALIYDISNNLDCVTVNRSINESYRFVNCTFLPTALAGNGDNWYLWVIYCAAVFCLSFFESVMETVLPVLAGDQLQDREEVRKFYAKYYWIRKLGEVISCLFCIALLLVLPQVPFDKDKFSGYYNFLAECWASFLIVSSTIGMATLTIALCGKFTREPRPDVSVITDTVGIWREVITRKGYRDESTSWLSPAMWSHGGSYPDGAVKERGHMMQFFVVVLCLIPVAFSTQIPVTFVPNYLYDETHRRLNLTAEKFLEAQQNHLEIVLFNMLSNRGASVLFILVVYFTSQYLQRRSRIHITFLHRLTVGQISMILSILTFLLTTHLYNFDYNPVAACTQIFLGICNALVYTAGYELTLVAAPRAMQATSMGLFYCLDGIANLINLAAVYTDYSEKLTFYMVAGVLSTLTGITVLILISKKFGLRLDK